MDQKVTIVILNWNGRKWLEKFLPFVLKSTFDAYSVLVVDNGSDDDSLEFIRNTYPGVGILELDQNYGFAGGNNRSLPYINTPYFVLLNSDVEVTPGWLEPLVDEVELHPEVASVQPKIRAWHQKDHFEYAGAAGGYLDKYGYPFCRGRVFDHLEVDQGQYDERREVFWATGACCLIRKSVIDEVGGLFDPDFFAHMEEIDFCWRLQNFGYKVSCRPDSLVYHVGGGTLPQGNPRKTYLNVRNNLIMLYKNLPQKYQRKLIVRRMGMDYLWGIKSLLTADFATLRAIFRAHKDYRSNVNKWREKRNTIYKVPSSIQLPENGYYQKSVVWEYFIKGKKKWSELMRNFD